MEKNTFLRLHECMVKTASRKFMVDLTAVLLSPLSEDFREAMENLVYSLLMKKQLLPQDIAHAEIACGRSIGNT